MNKEKYVSLGRTISLFNVALFKNPKSYILGIALPVFISLLMQFLWAKFSRLDITPPEMLSFIFISVVLSSFYIGLFSHETRRNLFREKIILKLNNENTVKYSFIVLVVELASINLLLTTIIFFGLSQANAIGFSEKSFSNIVGVIWFYFVVFGLMLGIMSGLIFLLLEAFFNKKFYALIALPVALAFLLFFSDTIIPAKIVSNINALTIIGYFDPIKYITWSMNLLGSYQFEDPLGSTQIYIQSGKSFEPFSELWQTTVPAIILFIALGFGYTYKKENN